MNSIEIKNMTTKDRLHAMEALWDSLLHEEREVEPPEWHQDVLENRKKKLRVVKRHLFQLKN